MHESKVAARCDVQIISCMCVWNVDMKIANILNDDDNDVNGAKK